jgi:hypothetical protein
MRARRRSHWLAGAFAVRCAPYPQLPYTRRDAHPGVGHRAPTDEKQHIQDAIGLQTSHAIARRGLLRARSTESKLRSPGRRPRAGALAWSKLGRDTAPLARSRRRRSPRRKRLGVPRVRQACRIARGALSWHAPWLVSWHERSLSEWLQSSSCRSDRGGCCSHRASDRGIQPAVTDRSAHLFGRDAQLRRVAVRVIEESPLSLRCEFAHTFTPQSLRN